MFTNNLVKGVHETRYIISWLKAGGGIYYLEDISDFSKWLKSEGLTDSEVDHIVHMATNGKLELETSADEFLSKIR